MRDPDLWQWAARTVVHEWHAWGHELVASTLAVALWERRQVRRARRAGLGAGTGP